MCSKDATARGARSSAAPSTRIAQPKISTVFAARPRSSARSRRPNISASEGVGIGSRTGGHSVFRYSTSASLSLAESVVPNSCPWLPLAFCDTSSRLPRRSASGPCGDETDFDRIVDVVAAIEDLRPLRRRLEQIAEARNGAVVKIGGAQPDAVEECGDVPIELRLDQSLALQPHVGHDLVRDFGARSRSRSRGGCDRCRFRPAGRACRSVRWHGTRRSSWRIPPCPFPRARHRRETDTSARAAWSDTRAATRPDRESPACARVARPGGPARNP